VEQAAFFYVRDQHSKQIVDHPKVRVAPDITFLKPVRPASRPDDSNEQRIVCGVNLRHTPGLQTDRWIEALKRLPYTLRGIPFSTFHVWKEMSILQQLDRTCATAFEQDLYDGLSLMIGTAFHSVVFAVQAAVPVIAVASTPKVRHFMCDVGLEDYLLEPDDWPKLRELADRVLGERDRLCHQLRQISTALTESAQQAMTTVRAQIGEAPARQQEVDPRVSLVVVSNSSSEANRKSIESCLDQTYSNIEVLFIGNDTKASGQYSFIDARLKIIQTNHESWAMSLNQALAQASGEYLSWILAGDFHTRDAIEYMMDLLRADPACDMVFTDFYTTQDHSRIVDAHIVLEPHRLIRRNVVGPSFLLRRRLCDTMGPLRIDTPLPDYDYWLRANTRCRLKPVHTLLYYARLSHQSMYNRSTERATRRRWYATRPRLARAIWFLVDTDPAEYVIVRPLLAIRRGVNKFLSWLSHHIGISRSWRNVP
jgi:glycosyltransferase involved in cell wall biosynthesis